MDRQGIIGIFTADTPLVERDAIIEAARQYVRLEESRKRSDRAKMAWAKKRARASNPSIQIAESPPEGPQ